VHGLVETRDGSLLAQLSVPDMRLPIQLAISYPERWEPATDRCDLSALGDLHFELADETRFPCLALARRAAQAGGTAPAAANAADEVLVTAFLAGHIPWPAIAAGIGAVLDACPDVPDPDLDAVLTADRWARSAASRLAGLGESAQAEGEHA